MYTADYWETLSSEANVEINKWMKNPSLTPKEIFSNLREMDRKDVDGDIDLTKETFNKMIDYFVDERGLNEEDVVNDFQTEFYKD